MFTLAKASRYRSVSGDTILGMAMTLRLSEEETHALREAAKREGKSMQEVAVTALREYLAKREKFRNQQIERFLQEDAELLDLLSR